MPWQLFGITSVVATALANVYQKIVMREDSADPIVHGILFEFLTGIWYLLFALVIGFHLPPLSTLPFFVVSTILYGMGTICFFRAIKLIEASEMSILNGVGPIVSIVTSFLFLNEKLNIIQLAGVVCILGAVVLINLKRKRFQLSRGEYLAIGGTCCYSLALIPDTMIIRSFEVTSFLPLISFGPALFLMLWYHQKSKAVGQHLAKLDKKLLIYSLLYAVSAVMFYQGIAHGALVGQMSTIARAAIILTVILSGIWLKERKHFVKNIIGAVITTIGVLLVSQ